MFSIPRTGTNHLLCMMKKVKRLKVYFEIFHPEEAFGINRNEASLIADRYNKEFESNKDKKFIKWARNNPLLMIDFLSERAKKCFDYMILKIFPTHLHLRQIDALLGNSQQTRAIIIKRNAIDSFISLTKSNLTGYYNNCDTSKLQVNLSVNYFKSWYIQNYNWYRAIESMLTFHQIPTIYFNYENDIYVSEKVLENIIRKKLFDIGVDSVFRHEMENRGLIKQDKENRYDHKCKNWSDFVKELECYGLKSKAFSHI
jgi:hypothetical protein